MKRVTNGHVLTHEEYTTLFTRIKAILNSRPLCYSKNLSQEEVVLTPGHFLIGQPLTAIPILEDPNEERSLSRRASLLKNQILSFWNAWSKDYIVQLHTRNK